jgi:hypothetical protein
MGTFIPRPITQWWGEKILLCKRHRGEINRVGGLKGLVPRGRHICPSTIVGGLLVQSHFLGYAPSLFGSAARPDGSPSGGVVVVWKGTSIFGQGGKLGSFRLVLAG